MEFKRISPGAHCLHRNDQLLHVEIAALTAALDGALVPAERLALGARKLGSDHAVSSVLRVANVDAGAGPR